MYSFIYPSLCHFKQRKSFFLGESNDERIAKQKLLLLLFLFSFFGFYKVTNLHWTFGWILVHFSCCILDSCYFLLMGFSYNSFLCSLRERTRLFWRGRKKKKNVWNFLCNLHPFFLQKLTFWFVICYVFVLKGVFFFFFSISNKDYPNLYFELFQLNFNVSSSSAEKTESIRVFGLRIEEILFSFQFMHLGNSVWGFLSCSTSFVWNFVIEIMGCEWKFDIGCFALQVLVLGVKELWL